MILTKTPYRVSFFGGGTDYPEWFNENEGSILSAEDAEAPSPRK